MEEAAPNEKQVAELERNVAKLQKRFDAQKEKVDELEEEIHQYAICVHSIASHCRNTQQGATCRLLPHCRIHKKIMDVGGTKLKAAESRVNLVQTQIDQVNGTITKAGVALKTSQR